MSWREFAMALQLIGEMKVGSRSRAPERDETETMKRNRQLLEAL